MGPAAINTPARTSLASLTLAVTNTDVVETRLRIVERDVRALTLRLESALLASQLRWPQALDPRQLPTHQVSSLLLTDRAETSTRVTASPLLSGILAVTSMDAVVRVPQTVELDLNARRRIAQPGSAASLRDQFQPQLLQLRRTW